VRKELAEARFELAKRDTLDAIRPCHARRKLCTEGIGNNQETSVFLV
jgi:hypothetical protein